jgi:hypothetical protein
MIKKSYIQEAPRYKIPHALIIVSYFSKISIAQTFRALCYENKIARISEIQSIKYWYWQLGNAKVWWLLKA